ncbi:MAG: dTDP-4-dehydrorhamnose 3,5-epimerase [Deltaproteobacteria bacterium]|nr:dTDP-4-dehydrorhamnose 3,5-epimerase [Deltaproteobacteria bacterium]
MKIIDTDFESLKIVESTFSYDKRGIFVKTFNSEVFASFKIYSNFKEFFYSISGKNVIRGMHFQLPPFDNEKLVFVVKGKILDVVIDIRKSSQTFGKYYSIELSDKNAKAVFIPKGFAHGFKGIENENIVCYLTTSVYSKEYDAGIRWDSFEFNWNCKEPIISERDLNFISFSEIKSPF